MKLSSWVVLCAYFLLMIGVGIWARGRVRNASDFFTAGGSMPWWLAGISHHMSGYSSAVFVGYAALAYTSGISVYFWWAGSIFLALLTGARIFPARWSRLREHLHVISPLEYLKVRYDLATQQLLGWSGAFLKVFDVGAKWSASAILLHAFANVPFLWGILLTGGVTLVYSVMGGLWADALTDLSQFIIQLVAGLAMLFAVLHHLGGVSALWSIWKFLPPDNVKPFHGDYTVVFAAVYFFVNLLSYNGGTWSLAQRFLASSTGKEARRSALLSAALYLLWPPILFFPMWAAPIIFPHLAEPSESYALLTMNLLPAPLIGLVLAGLFAHTMAMTSSDANAVASVIIRDILPVLRGKRALWTDESLLFFGRVATFAFLSLSMLLAVFSSRFGGVIGIVILWYGALVGPMAIPMLLGLLTRFRRSGPAAAISCWLAGTCVFVTLKIFRFEDWPGLGALHENALTVGAPMFSSLLVYLIVGWVLPMRSPKASALLSILDGERSSVGDIQDIKSARSFNCCGFNVIQEITKKGSMDIRIVETRNELGKEAAGDIADAIRKRLAVQREVRIIFAAAPSQREMLETLVHEPGIDWTRVCAFHMDEYIGLPKNSPQRFSMWLRTTIFDRLPFGAVHLIDPGEDLEATCREYADKLIEAPIDLVLLGIGANGHLAFNDPPANLEDPVAVKVVKLDDVCRQQQVDDECFDTFQAVPQNAITLTVPSLLRGDALFCCVPGSNKSKAVRSVVHDAISGECPATFLRLHPRCTSYLDRDSSFELNDLMK